MSVENKMVVDSHWRELESRKEVRKVVAECDGCKENIYEDQGRITWSDGHGNWYTVHDDVDCTYMHIADIGIFERA